MPTRRFNLLTKFREGPLTSQLLPKMSPANRGSVRSSVHCGNPSFAMACFQTEILVRLIRIERSGFEVCDRCHKSNNSRCLNTLEAQSIQSRRQFLVLPPVEHQ